MLSGAGAERRLPRFLNGFRGPSGDLPLHKALASVVILIVVLSSFSFMAAVRTDVGQGEDGEVPARSTLIYPFAFVVTPTTAYVNDTITFTGSATSNVGSSLTFTIYFDYLLANGSVNPYSPVYVETTGNPGSISTTHAYTAPGNYSDSQYVVLLKIYDGDTTRTLPLRYVKITGNTAPCLSPFYEDIEDGWVELPTPAYWDLGVPLNLSVICSDAENDNLTLTWDFGDGSEVLVDETGPALVGVACNQTHTWNLDPADWYGIGDIDLYFYLNLSLADGMGHWTNWSTQVWFRLDRNLSPTGSITTNTSIVDPADVVWLLGTGSDPEGEPLTWTFVFNNSVEDFLIEVYHTDATEPGATVYQNTSYTFSEVGNYTVTLYLSDLNTELQNDPEFSIHNMTVGHVVIESVLNSLPSVLATIMAYDYYTGQQDVKVNDTTGLAIAVLYIKVLEEDGEVLNATWDFGDGSGPAYNVSLGGIGVKYYFNQTHQFPGTGQYNVSVVITDGREGHEVLKYRLLNISSNNLAPEVLDLDIIYSNGSYGLPGSVVVFILTLFDLERDPLEVAWDFGDGSPLEWTNVSSFAENGSAVCTISHVFEEIDVYTVKVNFTDGMVGVRGMHAVTWEIFVFIKIPPPDRVRIWDWWDYTSLALLILSIGLMIAWAVIGSVKRSRFDMMGTTLEEYKLRKQEIELYEKRHRDEGGSG